MLGSPEILIIIILLLLIFGASRVPAIMENLGKGFTSFKKGLKEESDENKKPLENNPSEDIKSEDKEKADG